MKSLIARMMMFTAGVVIGACAAVGVPASDDPWKKYLQGCALLEVGRVFPAHDLLTESMDYYEHAGDPMRLALVQSAFATLIQSPTFVVHPLFHKRRMALGGREALPARAHELLEKSRDNLQRALAAPSAVASAPERTQVFILLMDVQARLGERREACESLRRAAASYRDAAGAPYEYPLYRYRTVDELLEARRRSLECDV